MNRIEIEAKLNTDRAWLLEALSAMSPEELNAPRTPSEHDASKTWSYANLNQFLIKPAAYVTKTKMTFGGLKDQDRADMLAYLQTLSDAPKPYPAP